LSYADLGRESLYAPHNAVLTSQVESVSSVTPINAAFIPEYLLPQMRQLAGDEDIFVRATYAKGLVRLADAALSMLEYSQAAKAPMSELESSGVVEVCSLVSKQADK
jgi:phosphoinositide-3-kinase regulatory subunit 4